MTGAVNAKQELTLFTKFKLQLQLLVACWLHLWRAQYRYVFPQGARPGESVRPCDCMSHYVLMRDPFCAQVHVPDAKENLLSREDRVTFVEDIAKKHKVKIFGIGMMFHPAHFRGAEDDPMKDIFNFDGPELPQEGQTNVVKLRRTR
jgi:hypothetical protein